jgi:hypothetical protein
MDEIHFFVYLGVTLIIIIVWLNFYCIAKREKWRHLVGRLVLSEMYNQRQENRQQHVIIIDDPPPAYSTIGQKY